MIVARITIRGQEHLAIALSADERENMKGGGITTLDVKQAFADHLALMMAFEGPAAGTRIAIMTEEALAARIAGCETAVQSLPAK